MVVTAQRRHWITRARVLAAMAMIGVLTLAAHTVAQQPSRTRYAPPRTPWGDPDLQGTYTNKDEYGTPLERPDDHALAVREEPVVDEQRLAFRHERLRGRFEIVAGERASGCRAQRSVEVADGDRLITIESMKLQMILTAPRAGRIRQIHVGDHDSFDRGAVLISFDTPERVAQGT